MFPYHLKVTMWDISVKVSTKATLCEYEVNLSTNEKVITEKQNFNTNCKKNNIEYRGQYEANPGWIHQSIS